MKTSLRGFAWGLLAFAVSSSPGWSQTSYTWTGGGTVTNSWSDTANWSPNAPAGGPTGVIPSTSLSTNGTTGAITVTAGPSSGDTVNLNDTGGANRTVIYDSPTFYGSTNGYMAGALGTLNIAQTGVGTNSLTVTKSLWIQNPVVLGATGGGVAEIEVAAGINFMAGINGVSGGFSNNSTSPYGVTINSGGLLLLDGNGDLGDQNNSASGNVLVAGGTLQAGVVGAGGANVFDPSSATMTSGRIEVEQGVTLRFFNNFIATGGQIALGSGATAATVYMGGPVEVLLGVTLSPGLSLNLNNGATTDSIYADNQLANVVLNLQASDGNPAAPVTTNKVLGLGNVPTGSLLGTGVYSFNTNGGPLQVGQINMFLNGSATSASALILQLATDVTVTGSNTIVAQNSDPGAGLTPTLGIDANGHTLDLTARASGWSASSEGGRLTTWNLSSTAGGGKIKATYFTLNAANTAVNVGAGLTLQATGAGGTTSDLGSANGGTVNSASTFVYAGSATGRGAGAANVISNRAIGGLQVQSGALNINQAALTSADVLISGGSLDLNGTGAGTLTLTSGANFFMNGGTLDFSVGSSLDAIVGAGGVFNLTNGTIALDVTGINYGTTYTLFSGFASGTVSNSITFTGLTGYTASLSSSGVLSFTAVPEPSALASMAFGAGILFFAARRRLRFPA